MSGIDHLVLACHDLEAARARYRALGFTLTPPARHPFGTGNSLVQLDGAFLELLAIAAPADIPEHGLGKFSFAAFNRDFLADREGLSMLVLASDDARREAARMKAAGLAGYSPFDFSRTARLPSGEEVTVGFSLAFTSHPSMPGAGFFFCQQHAPQHFWRPEYQRHANTAVAVEEVGMAANEPGEVAEFLGRFAGKLPQRDDPDLIEIDTGRGRVTIATPSRYRKRWGFDAPALERGARFGAIRLAVADMTAARAAAAASGIAADVRPERIAVGPQALFGTGLVLSAPGGPGSST